jgi:hypothetical protein
MQRLDSNYGGKMVKRELILQPNHCGNAKVEALGVAEISSAKAAARDRRAARVAAHVTVFREFLA